MKLTKEQSDIKNALTKTNSNLIVVARAGTGKSSTIEAIAPRNSTILCFNRAPADEMAERLGSGRTASTFHKFGKMLFPKGSFLDSGTFKVREHIQSVAFRGQKPIRPQEYDLQSSIASSVSWLKTMAVKPDATLDQVKQVLTDDRLELAGDVTVDQIVEHSLEVLRRCAEKSESKFSKGSKVWQYNFDDMQWIPYVMGWGSQQVETLFIDEAQDLNPIRMALTKLWGQRIIAVGDDRQAIYAFNGSMSSSLSLLQEEIGAKPFPLTVCWRCPHSHLELARNIVPDIQDRPDCPDGTILDSGVLDPNSLSPDGHLILCRTNAPLIRHYLKWKNTLSQQVVFFASDGIVKTLTSLVGWKKEEVVHGPWRDKFNKKIEKKLQFMQSPMAKAVLQDYREVIDQIIDSQDYNVSTVGDLHTVFEQEFKKPETKDIKPDAIKLSSIHASKGLEHNTVTLYGTNLLPHPKATRDWELQQEANLEYVALTRSKNTLIRTALES